MTITPPPAQNARLSIRLQFWGELAIIAILTAEILWISDWYEPLTQPQAPWLETLAILAAIFFGSHLLIRGMASLGWQLPVRRLAIFTWIILVTVLSLGALLYRQEQLGFWELATHPVLAITLSSQSLKDFWHILVILLLVLRAIALAHESANLWTAQLTFQFGLLMMLVYGLIFSWAKPQQAVLTLYGFLFASLLAMGAARISELSRLRGGRLPILGFSWTAGIIGSTVAVVGLGILTGWTISTWAIETLKSVFSMVILIFTLLGMLVLSPLILLILWFVPELSELLDALFNSPLFTLLRNLANRIAEAGNEFPSWLAIAIKIIVPIILVLILITIVLLIVAGLRWNQRQQKIIGEIGDLGTIFSEPTRLPKFPKRLSLRQVFGRGDFLAAARIRWIYAQLLKLAAEMGKPRPNAATPLEFLPELETLFPDDRGFLRQITQAYNRIRYGEFPESQAEVREVSNGWNSAKNYGKKVAASKRRKRNDPE